MPGNVIFSFDDLNNDGYIEIITNEVSPDRISIKYGNSSAYYSYSVSSPILLYSPTSIKIADVNGDLIKDIVFSQGASGGNIGIIRGNITGGFDAPYYLNAASGKLLDIRDFNQDTYPDLLMINQNSEVRVVAGKGNGTFDNSITIFNTLNNYDRLFVNDFNQDSKLDIIATNLTSTTNGSIKVYSGITTGGFYTVGTPLTYTVFHNGSNSAAEFFINDFNNDGYKDFAVTSSNGINLFNNNGTGTFSITTISTYGYPGAISGGDFNNDGNTDLVVSYPKNVTSLIGNMVRIFIGNGNGTFNFLSNINISATADKFIVKDFDKNGALDIVCSMDACVGILFGNNQAQFSNSFTSLSNENDMNYTLEENLLDLNNDGYFDIVSYLQGGGVMISKGLTDSTVTGIKIHPLYGYGTSSSTAEMEDFNMDGNLDIAVFNEDSVYTLSVYYSNSLGELSAPTVFRSPKIGIYYSKEIVSGNFNADNYPDVIVKKTMYLGSAAGITSQTVGLNITSGIIGKSDLNHDGKMDLIGLPFNSQSVQYMINSGNGIFSSGPLIFSGNQPVWAEAADLNNDTYADLIIANDGAQVKVVLGTSNISVYGTATNYTTGTNPNDVKTGDFNGDGNIDVAVSNRTSNNVSILLGNGTGSLVFSNNVYLGPRPETINVLDFNQDGILDLAVKTGYVRSELLFFKGNGNGTFSYLKRTQTLGNLYVTGDLNHDNVPDLVNASDRFLHVLYSGAPSIKIGGLNNACMGTPLQLTALGANSYTWSTNENTANVIVTPTTTSTYSVIGKDSQGCASSALKTITVSANPSPTLSILGNTVICSGSLTSLNVSGANTYTWNNGSTGSSVSISLSATNTISVVGTDLNGCQSTSTIAVTTLSVPNTVITGSNTLCSGNTTSLSLLGLTTNTISWNTGASSTSISVNPSTTTTYSALVTASNGCTKNNSKTVLVSPTPTISISGPSTMCSGETSTLVASGASTYIWSDSGANTNTVTVSPYTSSSSVVNYYVYGTSASGCLSSAVFTATVKSVPIVTIIHSALCAGAQSTFAINGASTHTWSNGATTSVINVTPTVNGSYTVSGQAINGCNYIATKNYIVYPTPALSISSSTNICAGNSRTLTVTGAYTYTWSTNTFGSSVTVMPTTNATYTVIGKDLNNCTNTQTVSVIVDPTCQDVWPGDANSDGIADNLDVLELGLHYTQTGAPRAITSNAWQSYFANNWTGTITNGKNLNHSDCNGDGIINDNDTLAIYNNYGLTHAFKPAQTNTVNPQLSIVPDQTSVVKGTWGSASIYLGDATTSISNINGLAFTIDFDNTLIETNNIYIEYQNSFIDAGQNLHFRKLDFANSKLFTATTHTVNNNVSGFGKIATLHYQIKSNLATDQVLNLGISQANQSDASGAIVPLSSGTGTLMALGASVGLQELNGNVVSVSPNPTNGSLTIHSKTELQKIEIVSITGQILLSEVATNGSHTLHLDNFANGIYFVNLYQNNRIVKREKIVLNK
jgi:hypothetical protein